ncbi:MAG TPA: glycosyltransferase family 39 protein [Gemmataceae bacterium]|nr:glycosyltransferase family 39 protein [Gemmataceae bacterium]
MHDTATVPVKSIAPSRSWTSLLPAWGWLLAGIVAVQFGVAVLFPVLPEEAYHWNFARHLDWSYYDHPPVLPWAIALGRLLLGDTALGIRLVPLLLALSTSLLLARLARRFYGDTAALWAVLLYALEPAAFFVGGWGFPDAPVLFFWMLTLTWVWNALETRRRAWWLAAGAALGGAMLSKYTAAFLVPSVLLYLVCSRRDRHWLATPWPYLAGVCSLIVFTPVIYWNWTHAWVSFRMQSVSRFQTADSVSLGYGLKATFEQWLFVLPLTLPLALVTIRRLARFEQPQQQFLFWSFAPMALFFFLLGWTPSWHLLWSLPAYLGLTVAMAGAVALPERVACWYRLHWARLVVTEACVVVVVVVHAVCVFPGVPPLRETYGWDEVTDLAKLLHSTLPPGSFYLTSHGRPYPCTSQLAFHLRKPYEVFGQNLLGGEALQYRFWSEPWQLAGKDAVVVVAGGDRSGLTRAEIRQFFQTVEPAINLIVPHNKLGLWPGARSRFALYLAHGYRPAPGPRASH